MVRELGHTPTSASVMTGLCGGWVTNSSGTLGEPLQQKERIGRKVQVYAGSNQHLWQGKGPAAREEDAGQNTKTILPAATPRKQVVYLRFSVFN